MCNLAALYSRTPVAAETLKARTSARNAGPAPALAGTAARSACGCYSAADLTIFDTGKRKW